MNKYDTSIYIQMSNGSRAIISPIKEIFYLIPGILIIALFGSIFMLFSLPTFEEIQASGTLYPSAQYIPPLILGLVVIILIIWGIFSYYGNTSNNLKSANIKMLAAINNKLSIDAIIPIIDELGIILSELKSKKFILSIFCNMRAMQKIIELEEMQINGTIKIIEKLRSDLATRLAEQRSALESAKTEVEKNITGTPELMTVSEVQRVRLDRQIEQFEELQRVLVRV